MRIQTLCVSERLFESMVRLGWSTYAGPGRDFVRLKCFNMMLNARKA